MLNITEKENSHELHVGTSKAARPGARPMQTSQMHYLLIAPAFFAIFVGIFFIVFILRSASFL